MSAQPGKRYRQAIETFDREQEYLPADAIKILKSLPDAKFDETVEIAFRLGIDTRKNEQALRGTVALPHGTGRSVRVAVFAAGIIWENRHGPIWPLFVATAAFLYLWLLAALLLDLIVAWHFYIKLSVINERIREIAGVVGPDGKAVVGAEEQVAT